jgi:hypothetical protein
MRSTPPAIVAAGSDLAKAKAKAMEIYLWRGAM